MNKKIILVFIFAALISGIFLISSSENDNYKISKEVYSALEKQETIRVIIQLNEPVEEKGFFIESKKSADEIEKEKKEIKEEILNSINEENVKHIFDDSIAIEISEAELEGLNDNINIESVIADKKIYAFLQDSVPYINATGVWPLQISGINLTGTDETICVIDTGINFSHPALIGKNKTCIIDCRVYPLSSGCIENCSLGDDNGHGTHVAGIAAASGGINGVTIAANLIGIKVLDSSGSGWSSDAYAGIDWCVDNAATYNISIISMSLGDCTNHNTYCNSDGAASHINSAVANNISVVIAAGNCNPAQCPGVSCTLGPTAPACVQNATAIGAVNDADSSISYQRGSLFELLAPGISINSTKRDGTYFQQSGTSMATPHVAGAFALFRQFFKLQYGRVPTPDEIRSTFNSTGKQINDTTGTKLNYSRIDVYAAINLFLTEAEVEFISPLNNSYINLAGQNQTFICNSTSLNFNLKNITFYLWNSSSLVYNLTTNISGTKNQTNFSYNFSVENSYLWNCIAKNNNSISSSNSNYTIIYDTTKPGINLISPGNSTTWTSSSTVSFSYNVSDVSIANCSLIINSSVDQNDLSITVNTTEIFTKSLNNGNYNWSINCTDSAGNINNSEERTLAVSYTAPPADTGSSSSGSGGGAAITSMTYIPDISETIVGYTKTLAKNDKIKFTFFDGNNEQHSLTLNFVGKDFINLTINSEPIRLLLGIGQSAKLNLTNSEYYDLYIKLNSIVNNKAEITLQTIHEKISGQSEITGNVISEGNNTETPKEIVIYKKMSTKEIVIYAIGLIVIIIGVIIAVRKKTFNDKEKTKKEYRETFRKHVKPR